MPLRRTLATATSAAALTALVAGPVAAAGMEPGSPQAQPQVQTPSEAQTEGDVLRLPQDVRVVTEPGESTVVVDAEVVTGQPHPDIRAMVITEGRILGGSDGFETEIVRSDTWQPGYRKAESGDYVRIRRDPDPNRTRTMELVRSDTWQPGYRKAESGDYVKLAPANEQAEAGMEVAIIVESMGGAAAQVITIGAADVPSNLYRQRSDTWRPGYLKTEEGDYYQHVVIRRSLPASELPDFD